MKIADILTAKSLKLKPNPYLKDPSVPFLYQRRGVLMMLAKPRMVLGDDVGLGKTLEAIVSYSYLKTQTPDLRALVLTEKIALRQWLTEFNWLTQGLKVKLITRDTHGDPSGRVRAFRQHGVDVIVTTYSMIYKYGLHILEGLGENWILIADEPNYFKSTRTKLHKLIFSMVNDPVRGAKRAYGLTATVIENRLEEAFAIFRVISPGTFATRAQFERDFCITRRIPHVPVPIIVGYRNLDAFRAQIAPSFFGRLQDDPEVMQALPEVLSKDLEIELNEEQSWKVMEAMDRIIQMPGGQVKALQVLPSLIVAQQMVDDPHLLGFNIESEKLEALMEMLTNSLAGERVVVYSKLRQTIDVIEARLRKERLECVRITGAESQEEREESKRRFMSDGMDVCKILLMTKAGQKAVNLQKGGHLFFFDMPWSYGLYRQTVGRLKRTGSIHKTVGVYRLLGCLHPKVAAQAGSEKTIDHYALEVVMKKFKLWQAITGDVKEIESSNSDVVDIWTHIRETRMKAHGAVLTV